MDIFTRTDGKQYHYVKRYAREVIEPRAVIDFGVRDQKARRVGMSRNISHVTVVLREQRPELDKRIERSRKLAVKKFGA